jgi:site-specific recombinase XerD
MSLHFERFAYFLTQTDRSPHTIRNYLCDLQTFAVWFEQTNSEALEPAQVTPTDLRAYKRWLVAERRFKPNSVNRHLATLKSFLQWAIDIGLVPDARAWQIPPAEREQRPGPRWLDRHEQHKLVRIIERAERTRDLAIVQLLLHTGLRVQELCTLRWQDVTIRERKGTLTVTAGKGGIRRQVPLNQTARQAFLSLGYQHHVGTDKPVFTGQRGPMTPRGVQLMLVKYAAAAGLEQVSPHTLRHTFCKNLVDAGVGLEQVAALAGHESLETTRRYCTPSLRDLEKALALIDASA